MLNLLIIFGIFVTILQFNIAKSCQILVPPELLNACTFNPLIIMEPSSGFTMKREQCYDAVNKDDFMEQPYVYFDSADEDKTYAVIMIDPDAPNHNVGQFYLHWIINNIPGYILKQGLGYTVGDTVMEYTGPAPPAFSGSHRYMIFAYEQTDSFITLPMPEFRARFDLMEWMNSFGGENALRGPVGSIGFVSEF